MSRATPTSNTPAKIQPCANCGHEVFYSVSRNSYGFQWIHSDTYYVTCGRKRPQGGKSQ